MFAVHRGTFRMSTAANCQGWCTGVLIKGNFLEGLVFICWHVMHTWQWQSMSKSRIQLRAAANCESFCGKVYCHPFCSGKSTLRITSTTNLSATTKLCFSFNWSNCTCVHTKSCTRSCSSEAVLSCSMEMDYTLKLHKHVTAHLSKWVKLRTLSPTSWQSPFLQVPPLQWLRCQWRATNLRTEL